jgi:hypothetical protein
VATLALALRLNLSNAPGNWPQFRTYPANKYASDRFDQGTPYVFSRQVAEIDILKPTRNGQQQFLSLKKSVAAQPPQGYISLTAVGNFIYR